MNFQEIAYVKSQFNEPADPEFMKEKKSTIIVKEDFVEGLDKIEDYTYLQIIFYLHKTNGYKLIGKRRMGEERGVFASRSPARPNSIGVTTVKLLNREGSILTVIGLDAIDGTPILDIKPYSSLMDKPPVDITDPRSEINRLVDVNNIRRLLIKAGELHGHYCPYLSLGVKAAVYGLRHLKLKSDGMEELLAILETNSCFSDGVQYASGCTFGNNGLIYRDYGKTAVTLLSRKGSGIRLHVKEREDFVKKHYPETSELFQKVIVERKGTLEEKSDIKKKWSQISFELLDKPVEELFDIEYNVNIDLPAYAPIFADRYCSVCGEKIMEPKAVNKNGKTMCIQCANTSYLQLDGSGLTVVS